MRKIKWNIMILATALALIFVGAQANALSQPGKQAQTGEEAKEKASQGVTVYRVNYKVSEVESGNTINSRSYTLMAQPGKTMSVRIGNKVPYTTANNTGKGFISSIQYSNVGMDIDCTIDNQGGDLLVHTKLDMNTLAAKEPQTALERPPVFNNLRLVDTTSAKIGKPTFVGSVDDVASNRQYVIEVTVTKEK